MGLDYKKKLYKLLMLDRKREKGGRVSSERRKRNCYFCKRDIKNIDYKDIDILKKFTTSSGRLLSSRITRICPKHQRRLTNAVKRAREIALLPFVETSYR